MSEMMTSESYHFFYVLRRSQEVLHVDSNDSLSSDRELHTFVLAVAVMIVVTRHSSFVQKVDQDSMSVHDVLEEVVWELEDVSKELEQRNHTDVEDTESLHRKVLRSSHIEVVVVVVEEEDTD